MNPGPETRARHLFHLFVQQCNKVPEHLHNFERQIVIFTFSLFFERHTHKYALAQSFFEW